MNYRMLGCRTEYLQIVKRLEEIANALPGTPEAQERKELIQMIRDFEKEVLSFENQQPVRKKKVNSQLVFCG